MAKYWYGEDIIGFWCNHRWPVGRKNAWLGSAKKWINFLVENYLLPIKVANIELDRLFKKCFGKPWPSIGTHN